ncbi:hypothetical protein [Dyella sp.]|uniref:hypothetical protein n=1 Tax=Dyella sp. TaxID=1869338 RepID=UPI002D79438A|nr:hypothetical protein [Dyella sp.]HET7331525.1 hypothetical protein [Dyella sp.]
MPLPGKAAQALVFVTLLIPALRDLGIIDIAGSVGILLPIDIVFLALPAFVLRERRVQPVRAR